MENWIAVLLIIGILAVVGLAPPPSATAQEAPKPPETAPPPPIIIITSEEAMRVKNEFTFMRKQMEEQGKALKSCQQMLYPLS